MEYLLDTASLALSIIFWTVFFGSLAIGVGSGAITFIKRIRAERLVD